MTTITRSKIIAQKMIDKHGVMAELARCSRIVVNELAQYQRRWDSKFDLTTFKVEMSKDEASGLQYVTASIQIAWPPNELG